ncbi:WD repeat-containing and planar cell polarity effector protein fritz homolog [Dermatophagoides pteronyssinus]|uniref:WD repeat-containing and planar cell polarity effector protein fritz homolog n=1 Tax=Dermatophagoides pteronyssinus TaxID=6956 RepID=UPI003F671A44
MPKGSSFELSSLLSRCLLNGYQPNIDRLKSYQIQKIRRRLKLLEHYLINYSVCHLKWFERLPNGFRGIVFAFNHGLISSICFDSDYQSIIYVGHDHIVPNKLSSKRISSIEITDNAVIIAFVEPFIAMIEFDDSIDLGPKLKFKNNYRLKHLEQLGGHNNGRGMAKRNIAICESVNLALLWSNRMPHRPINKLLPITPTVRPTQQQIEKNLALLTLDDFRLIEFDHSINGEILQADFVTNDRGKFGVLHKQKTSVYNLTYSLFECIEPNGDNVVPNDCGPIKLLFEIGIPLEKLCFGAEFTRLQDKILLLCDDESVMLFNIEQNVLYALNSSKPICHMAMYPLDSLFVTCDPNGSISFYDIAFQNIIHSRNSISNDCHPNSNMSVKRLQFLSADILVVLMVENRRQDSIDTIGHSQQPISSILRTKDSINHHMTTTCCMKLYHLPYRLSFKHLINEYLYRKQYEESLNVLRTINWNCSSEQAYHCLHIIFQHLITAPLSSVPNGDVEKTIDKYIESTLATFLLPMTPIDYKIFEQILPDIRQLAIRFFYHLVRNGSFEKAYQLGIELKSTRLFLLLAQLSRMNGQLELSNKSHEQARKLLN